MTQPTGDPAATLADHGLDPAADTSQDEALLDPDDPDFQPRSRARLHWFTAALIGLLIWAAGFLTGVLVDRSVAAALGG